MKMICELLTARPSWVVKASRPSSAFLLDELGQPGLVDRDLALAQHPDLGLVLVHAHDVVAGLGQTGAHDQPDVPGTDHRNLHRLRPLLSRRILDTCPCPRRRGVETLQGITRPQCCQHTDPQGLVVIRIASLCYASSRCGFCSTTAPRCARAPASASSFMSWRAPWPRPAPDAADDRLAVFTASWSDRPAPALAAELDGRHGRRSPDSGARADLGVESPGLAADRAAGRPGRRRALAVPAADPDHAAPRRSSRFTTCIFCLVPTQRSGDAARFPGAGARSRPARRSRDRLVALCGGRRRAPARRRRRPHHGVRAGRAGWAAGGRARNGRAAATPAAILFVGTLEPRKNIGGLLDAYARASGAAARRAAARAGRRHPRLGPRRCWPRAKRPPLAGHVNVLGYVSDADETAPLSRRRDAGPARRSRKASACRCSKRWRAACRSWCRTAGRCPRWPATPPRPVDPDDCEALSREMARLLDPDAAQRRRSRAGFARAAAFTWASVRTAGARAPTVDRGGSVAARRAAMKIAVDARELTRPADRRRPLPVRAARALGGIGRGSPPRLAALRARRRTGARRVHGRRSGSSAAAAAARAGSSGISPRALGADRPDVLFAPGYTAPFTRAVPDGRHDSRRVVRGAPGVVLAPRRRAPAHA